MLKTKQEFSMDLVCETSLGKGNRWETAEIMSTTTITWQMETQILSVHNQE